MKNIELTHKVNVPENVFEAMKTIASFVGELESDYKLRLARMIIYADCSGGIEVDINTEVADFHLED